MGVGVKGDNNAAVPQPFADDLGVNSLGQHEAGMGMAEVMEAYPIQPQLPGKVLEGMSHIVGLQ